MESALKASIKRISSTDARSKINTLVSKAQGAVIVSVLAKSLPGLFVIVAAWIATKLHLNKRQYAKLISDMIQRDSEISVY